MAQSLLTLSILIFIISLINFVTIRIPKRDEEIKKSVTVLAPMRNEAENVPEFISALSSQMGVKNLNFVIINDGSTDKTAELLTSVIDGDPRFSVIDSPIQRDGWLGKVSALQSGYESARSEFIITLDADVRLQPNAIMRAISQLERLKLDFVSPYPRQIAQTFAEKLIQPLLHWSWMSTVILRLAEKFPRRSTAVANGQFFVARKNALDAINGFESVSTQILDDIELARSLISAGYRGVVTEGSGIASTRMYSSFDEIRQGYGKSLWKAFGGSIGTVIAIAFLFATGILPVLMIINGYLIGWLIYLYMVFSREISAIRSRSNPLFAFLHPLSSALLIYLIIYSWRNRGTIQWKGRTV
jgi:cellulose synthase/poly-beta-1,6-N-acetylglucosamine synthase-like glycosyltransferase